MFGQNGRGRPQRLGGSVSAGRWEGRKMLDARLGGFQKLPMTPSSNQERQGGEAIARPRGEGLGHQGVQEDGEWLGLLLWA